MNAFGIDLIICPRCWPSFAGFIRLMRYASSDPDAGPIPGSWTDDPDDAEECDICGAAITEDE